MEEKTEIAIIGAGPSGLIAAREAVRKGAKVTILEEHEEVGVPCQCAGLLSLNGLAEIQVPPDERFVQNKVKGAHLYSPSKLSFTVERDEPVACVVNRADLDKFLAEQATRAGAKLMLSSKVQGIKRLNGKIVLNGDFGTLKAEVIVDAEGLASRLVKEMGLQPLPTEGLLPGLQYDLEGVNVDLDHVELHVSRKVAPSFFAWVIPLNKNSVRVGLGCKDYNPREKLEDFIKDRFGGKEELSRLNVRSGLIITTGPIPGTFCDNFLVVGDAAGQVKPTTGGGVVWGGICAMIAGRVAAEAVETGSTAESFLRNYEVSWRRRLEKEVKWALLARRVTDRLSDGTVDKIFRSIKKANLQKELSLDGDMDFQAGAILRLVGRKDILGILLLSASDLLGGLKE